METTQVDKQELKDWIDRLDDTRTLLLLRAVKNSYSEGDWWDEISDAEKEAIEEGEADIKAGRVTPHKQVRKSYQKWL